MFIPIGKTFEHSQSARGAGVAGKAVEWQACMTQGRVSSGTQMRTGLSFNKQAVHLTGRWEPGRGGGGVIRQAR